MIQCVVVQHSSWFTSSQPVQLNGIAGPFYTDSPAAASGDGVPVPPSQRPASVGTPAGPCRPIPASGNG